MDLSEISKRKKGNLIVKTWERCKSLGRGGGGGGGKRTPPAIKPLKVKSRSWPRLDASAMREEEDDESRRRRRSPKKGRVAPEGCFSVYVGPEKQRFVIKTEYANHPLFKILLEEAESEYGYNPEGPLALPCEVAMFCKVLMAMEDISEEIHRGGCGFVKNYGGYQLLSPSRMIGMNQF